MRLQPGYIAEFSISPDGKKVALTRYSSSNPVAGSDIWVHELERGTESRFTFKGQNGAPVWSPDGSSIAYMHNATLNISSAEVYQKHTSGTGQEELLVQGALLPVSWSRDGRFLLLMSAGTSGPDLSVLPLEGDRKLVPFVASEFQEYQGKFSPDGTWIVYTSNESGRPEVYVEPFPRGAGAEGKRRVSTDGGEDPNWRTDGKELFYLDPGGRLLAVQVQSGGPKSGFSMGAPTALFDTRLLRVERGLAYRVAPDGKRFLVRTIKERSADLPLVLVTNWQAGLAK